MENELSSKIIKEKIMPVPISLRNYAKVRMTAESVYSVTRPDIAIDMARDIIMIAERNNLPHRTICDATANIGGNTLAFSLYFEKVYALEIKNKTHEILRNNLKVYRATNVYTKCSNLFNELSVIAMCDLVFIDPPWYLGRDSYDNTPVINRYLQLTVNLPSELSLTYSVDHFIYLIWQIRRVPVFIKAPPRYFPMLPCNIRISYKKMDMIMIL